MPGSKIIRRLVCMLHQAWQVFITVTKVYEFNQVKMLNRLAFYSAGLAKPVKFKGRSVYSVPGYFNKKTGRP
jgi:hypothetical protein